MKILILADGRSPITKNWLKSLKSLGHQIVLVSSYPCQKPAEADEVFILPIAFSGISGSASATLSRGNQNASFKKTLVRRFRSFFLRFRYVFGPLSLPFAGRKLRKIIAQTNPDLIHALRIPYEGMALSFYSGKIPTAISIWGNDITLHAKGSSLMRRFTIRTLTKSSGLAADSSRDIRLGINWGFAADKPTLIVPGSGGIDFTKIRLASEAPQTELNWIPDGWNIVINPRGYRPGSVGMTLFSKVFP